jgi:hypothetical protein
VSLLLESGAEVRLWGASIDKNYPIALMGAVGSSKCEARLVEMLIRHRRLRGQGLEDRNLKGETLLHHAVKLRSMDVMSLLLEYGALADSSDNDGKTPLMKACERADLGVVRRLVQHMGGQGLNQQDAEGMTALHFICTHRSDNAEVARTLLRAGADPTITDKWGRTPRQAALDASGGRHQLAVFDVRNIQRPLDMILE